ncbi:MAG TPA: PQQ-binding-like beta-propeller repeat protein [Phycisphaerae bacterium]|nr:PQQ-binding-like beta-propeller repeat protein [Phycisphaerae bacterium]
MQTGKAVRSSPAAAGGVVVVGSQDGAVYAVAGGEGAKATSAAP